MSEQESSYTRCIALVLIALGIFVYANTFKSDFIWDDASSVLLHQTVQDPSSVLTLFTEDQHAYAGGQGNFYRPLLAVTFMIDFWLSNNGPTIHESTEVVNTLSPLLFHIDSLIWHCMAALFFMLLLRNLKAPILIQALVPMLYIVHPLHTEAVSYISGRADSMSATFIFAGLFFATRSKLWLNIVLVVLCYIAGLLSKESSLIFPGLLVLTLYAHNKIESQQWDKKQLVAIVASAATFATYGVLRSVGPLNFGSDSQAPTNSFGDRIAETLQSFAYYMELLFSPSNLHMERTLVQATSTTTILGVLSLVAVLGITLFAFKKKEHRILLGSLWFLLTWLPISGIFPLNAPMAEHWMYVPMAGFLWALLELCLCVIPNTAGDAPKLKLRNAFVGLSIIWLIFLSLNSVERNVAWSSNTHIYSATLSENPKSTRVHYNLAVTYQDLENNPVGAKRHYTQILGVYAQKKAQNPSQKDTFWDEEIQSHYSLAQIYFTEQNYAEASKHFNTLAKLNPSGNNRSIVGRSMYGLGQCLLKTGRQQQAQTLFEQAFKIAPELAPKG